MATKLTCKQALSEIRPYLDDELGARDSASFLAHIKECDSCRHELETSFIVEYALQYLDNEKLDTFDIQGLLDEQILKSERTMARRQILTVFLWIGIIIMALLILSILTQVLMPEVFRSVSDFFYHLIHNPGGRFT